MHARKLSPVQRSFLAKTVEAGGCHAFGGASTTWFSLERRGLITLSATRQIDALWASPTAAGRALIESNADA